MSTVGISYFVQIAKGRIYCSRRLGAEFRADKGIIGVSYFGLSIWKGATIVFSSRKFCWLPLGFEITPIKIPGFLFNNDS
jgi:hypothetical protein